MITSTIWSYLKTINCMIIKPWSRKQKEIWQTTTWTYSFKIFGIKNGTCRIKTPKAAIRAEVRVHARRTALLDGTRNEVWEEEVLFPSSTSALEDGPSRPSYTSGICSVWSKSLSHFCCNFPRFLDFLVWFWLAKAFTLPPYPFFQRTRLD